MLNILATVVGMGLILLLLYCLGEFIARILGED